MHVQVGVIAKFVEARNTARSADFQSSDCRRLMTVKKLAALLTGCYGAVIWTIHGPACC